MKMKSNGIRIGLAGLTLIALSAVASGQTWSFECIDPANTAPYTPDYAVNRVGNNMMVATMGVAGQVTYGGSTGPCYAPNARTFDVSGRICFNVGNQGSVQSDFDDGLRMTFGAPNDPLADAGFGRVWIDDDSEIFGDQGLRGAFAGSSNRYMVGIWDSQAGNITVTCTVRVIADAARIQWDIQNGDTDPHQLGLRWGCYPAMLTRNVGVVDGTGFNMFYSGLGTLSPRSGKFIPQPDGAPFTGYTVLPTTKPVRTERNYIRTSTSFPDWAEFLAGQESSYGIHVDNQSTDATKDASRVVQFIIGNYGTTIFDGNMTDRVFDDFGQGTDPIKEVSDISLGDTSFIQDFGRSTVAPGRTTTIVHYYRAPWSIGDYNNPYAVVLDPPQLISSTPGQGDLNDLAPNPMTVSVLIDNQYATVDQAVPLNDVRVTIDFDPDSGLFLAPGETKSKIITLIQANQIANIDWQLIANGETFGDIPYTVKVEPVPGPVKTLNGIIKIAATPRLNLPEGANYVTFPWQFPDTSLDQILGMQSGVDYLAYRWDPDQLGYVPAASAERGRGVWIVPLTDRGFVQLNQATIPTDTPTGGYLYNLRRGWNAIGNPYNYPVKLSELIGVAEDDPGNSITWQTMVDNGLVSPSIAHWVRDTADPSIGAYQFTESNNAFIQPNQGLWIYVSTYRPIRVIWPPVFIKNLPNAGRATEADSSATWAQSARQWRLQLTARSNKALDTSNYVGVVGNQKDVRRRSIMEPPMAPGAKLELSIVDPANTEATRMAQAFTTQTGKKEWKVLVRAEEAGQVTINWPNLSRLPKNLRFRITDSTTNQTKDLRHTAEYTFQVDKPGTREFKITVEPGGSSRPVIGNVLVTRSSREASAPFSISYTLSGEASTTIRVLSGTGKEIFTVTRGRADRVGENTAMWATRDAANRAVPPGTYNVEITAETVNGERVRRVVPVNVTR